MPGAPADADAMDTSSSQGARAAAPPALCDASAVLADLEAAKRQVEAVRAAGDGLLEAIAAAGTVGSADISQQLTAVLSAADGALEGAKASWDALAPVLDALRNGRSAPVKRLEDEATAAALRDSVAAGSLQAAALRLEGLTTASAAADARTPGGLLTAQDRQANLAALQAVVSRVGIISGHSISVQQRRTISSTPAPAGLDPDDTAQVELRIDGVLCATIALALPQSLEPVRVAAFSVEEAAQGGAEAWGASELFTFRAVSAVSMRALLHFRERGEKAAMAAYAATKATTAVIRETPADGVPYSDPLQEAPLSPDEAAAVARRCHAAAVEDLLLWLCGYEDLFQRRCSVTGTLLALDPAGGGPMPPLLRPFRRDRTALLSTAPRGAPREAYHLHAAPLDEL